MLDGTERRAGAELPEPAFGGQRLHLLPGQPANPRDRPSQVGGRPHRHDHVRLRRRREAHLDHQRGGPGPAVRLLAPGTPQAGHLETLTYPNNQAVTYTYNNMGQETSLQDWLGNTTTFGYDGAGRLYTTTLPNGITESTVYDADSKVSSVTDAQGTTSVANFNYTYPVPRNADEELMSETDAGTPGPATQTYGHDTLRRVSADNSSTYTYDSQSQLTTGPGGSAQYFDPSGELCWSAPTMPQGPSCSSPPSGSTSYGFDADGDRTSATSGSSTTTYGWNQYAELTSTTSASTTVGYTHNASGLLSTRTQSGSSANFTWDPVGTADPLLVYDGTNYYIYGPGSLPTEQIAAASGTVDYYLHDQLGSTRLLTSSSGAVAGSWTYDAWGRTVASSGSSGGSVSISAVGSLAKGTGTTLSVSPQATGDLMLLTVDTNNSTPPIVTSVSGGGVSNWSFVKRLTDASNAGYDTEIWSGVVATTGPSTITITVSGYSNGNDLTAQEFSAGAGATWSIASSGALSSFGSPWDYPLLSAAGSGELYYGFAVRNNSGTLSGGGTAGFTYVATGLPGGDLVAYDASASGALQPVGADTRGDSYQDAVAVLVSATGGTPAATTPLLWAGQYQDPTTGLYYMRARWYDPGTGEFLSVDPDFNQTLDAYGYADENPLDGTDPSGLYNTAGDSIQCEFEPQVCLTTAPTYTPLAGVPGPGSTTITPATTASPGTKTTTASSALSGYSGGAPQPGQVGIPIPTLTTAQEKAATAVVQAIAKASEAINTYGAGLASANAKYSSCLKSSLGPTGMCPQPTGDQADTQMLAMSLWGAYDATLALAKTFFPPEHSSVWGDIAVGAGIALGVASAATGVGSLVLPEEAEIFGLGATALGYTSAATGAAATALDAKVCADGDNVGCFATGLDIAATGSGLLALGADDAASVVASAALEGLGGFSVNVGLSATITDIIYDYSQ